MDRGLKSYRAALDDLFARTGSTSKFGLGRTLALLELLGNPHQKIKTLHVAGTNGKGSVVATLYELLRSKGLSVGRYMSPHLIDFRERIVVDEVAIDEKYILQFLGKWGESAARLGATFFEITTAMAFDYFASRSVDIAVIETGLGGRLDSTNVITPIVSGITSIAIDHTEYLGKTEEEIAREKAGILKPGAASVIGEMSPDARVAIYRAAAAAGVAAVIDTSRLYRTSDVTVSSEGTSFTMTHGSESKLLRTGLVGAPQAANTAVALAMLHAAGGRWPVTLDEASAVLPNVKLAGRFQQLDRFIFDVAHNPDSMRALAKTLEQVKPLRPMSAILGVLSDKDWREMMRILSVAVDRIIIVAPPTAPAARLWDPLDALAFAKSNRIAASVDDFESAVRKGADYEGTTVVTGSFHTVGDALALLRPDWTTAPV